MKQDDVQFRQTPAYKKAVAKAEKRLANTKFESEGQKRDYMREVSQHDNNIPGMPVFFPPPLLWGTGLGEGQELETLPCGHKRFRVRLAQGMTVECRHGHLYDAEYDEEKRLVVKELIQ